MSGVVINGRVSPCEKFQCAHAANCKAFEIACSSFASFVYRGTARAPRTPDRDTFEALFPAVGRVYAPRASA